MHLQGLLKRREYIGEKDYANALARLTTPECPESLEYLLDWARELARTRVVGMNGAEGFTYPMVESWARLTDRTPEPYEVEALFLIDASMRFPDEPKGDA